MLIHRFFTQDQSNNDVQTNIVTSKYNSSVTAQLPGANGYTGGKVIFIDTEVHVTISTLD